jgi:hypothetical protein
MVHDHRRRSRWWKTWWFKRCWRVNELMERTQWNHRFLVAMVRAHVYPTWY